jgi:hypothetical protein
MRSPTLSDETEFPTALSTELHVRPLVGKRPPRHPQAQQRKGGFVECDAAVWLSEQWAAADPSRNNGPNSAQCCWDYFSKLGSDGVGLTKRSAVIAMLGVHAAMMPSKKY